MNTFVAPEKLYFGRIHFVDGPAGETLGYMLTLAASRQGYGPVIYVDCHNSFDPYYLHRTFKDRDPIGRLKKILVSRPFTVYQLRELVDKKLEEAVVKHKSKVLLVSAIDGFREDKETPIITKKVMDRIDSLTQRYGLITVVSKYRRWE
ncbi:MAG: hypothetical protein ABH950_03030 [Candidatus Altiarchaeota archaeon]